MGCKMKSLTLMSLLVFMSACASDYRNDSYRSMASSHNMKVLKEIVIEPNFSSNSNSSYFKTTVNKSFFSSDNCTVNKNYSYEMKSKVVLPTGVYPVTISEDVFERRGRFDFKTITLEYSDSMEIVCFMWNPKSDLRDVNKILKGYIVVQ